MQIQSILPIPNSSKSVEKQPSNSKYLEQYQKALLESIPIKSKQQYVKLLNQQNIYYDSNQTYENQQKNVSIKVIHKTQIGSCFTLLVRVGPFTLQVEVANVNMISQTHSAQHEQCGRFGDIYFVKRQEKKSAIKCLRYRPKVRDDFEKLIIISKNVKQSELLGSETGKIWTQAFLHSLKQYCFYKIFSALGIGPMITKILDFDIVCFSTCFQFSIEKCHQHLKLRTHNIEQEITYCLKVMHLFHIVHRDLKPHNILLSLQQNRYVLTDFGTTDIIKQDIGQTTMCQYVIGTYGYFCQQMKKIYEMWLKDQPRVPTPIDFYYNDLFGLKKSIKEIERLEFLDNSYQTPECFKLPSSQTITILQIYKMQINQKKLNFKQHPQIFKRIVDMMLYSIRNKHTQAMTIQEFVQKIGPNVTKILENL